MKHLHITRAALSQKTHYIILLPTPRWKKSFHSTTWISSYCKENKDTVCFIKPVYTSLYFNRMLVEHGILALYIGIDNLYGQE